MMPWLINAAQVDKFRKSQKALIILDASWHMPGDGRDGYTEFLENHIMGAQFFDINAFSDMNPNAPHPHMISTDDADISQKLGALGIRNDYKIILYDNSNLRTACRALWMLKVFGHNPQQLYILDGGLNAWNQYGGKTEPGQANVSSKQYNAMIQPELLRNLAQMKQNFLQPQEQVIDARHAVRYAGGPEIREGMRRGHIPGSFSFPYTTLFDKNGCWKPLEKIRQQLAGVSIDINKPIVTTCGSGITAAVINFALDLLGNTQNAVYNGSWNEWGAEKLFAGETSLAERPVKTSLE